MSLWIVFSLVELLIKETVTPLQCVPYGVQKGEPSFTLLHKQPTVHSMFSYAVK